ncbi:hypothetical protein FRC17_009208 [Serendipita sp. 399]|nr:hypothetical protein FRC17_009208 [Serendipita sp. 399]
MSSQRRPQQASTQSYSLDRANTFTKIDLKPRRYHFYNVLLFILGTFVPPLAVAARFGIGKDFWLNVFLTICGYIPGHGHNFYIQVGAAFCFMSKMEDSRMAHLPASSRNIRNNKNHRRTPKWAIRYGLVDDTEIRRREKRSRWAGKYNDRLPRSTLEGREVEEGQNPDRPGMSREGSAATNDPAAGGRDGALWNNTEEQFYGQKKQGSGSVSTGSGSGSHGGGRWRYPANFDDVVVDDAEASSSSKKKKGGILGGKKKKDRWELSEDARRKAPVPDGEYVGEPAKKKKKEKRRKRGGDGVGNDDDTYNSNLPRTASHSSIEEPEDPVGGLYGKRRAAPTDTGNRENRSEREDRDLFDHQF